MNVFKTVTNVESLSESVLTSLWFYVTEEKHVMWRRKPTNLVDFAAKNSVVQLSSFKEILSAVTSPATLRPFVILLTYFGIYQFSGANPVILYAVQVFQVRKLFA